MSLNTAPVLLLGMANISPVLMELLGRGSCVNLTVTGNSMYPFLREHIDSVLFERVCEKKLRIGDIILALTPGGRYVLHRVVKLKKDTFHMLGDAQTLQEGPFSINCVLAVVTGVYRRNKYINTLSFSWRILSAIWLMLRPVRPFLIFCRRAVFKNLKFEFL